jgi:hypothetical protein
MVARHNRRRDNSAFHKIASGSRSWRISKWLYQGKRRSPLQAGAVLTRFLIKATLTGVVGNWTYDLIKILTDWITH